MSVEYQINVFERGAMATVRELERELSPAKLQATYGPRCRDMTRDHLKSQPRNKRGWPSTNFWEQAARSCRWEAHGNFIKIIVDKVGVRQRWKGGHIAPVNAKALTIPISPISYGKTVADFPGAALIVTKKGAYIVMVSETNATKGLKGLNRRRAQRASLIFLFKLVGGVDQAPNPDVMPTMAEYRATCLAAARERLAGIKARKGGVTA